MAAHTNLDAARGGLNDVMAEILGITAATPLRPAPDMPSCGLGRIARDPLVDVTSVATEPPRTQVVAGPHTPEPCP